VGFKHLEWKIGHLQDSSAAMDATAGDVGARGYSKRDADSYSLSVCIIYYFISLLYSRG
jgi:hypothetical protein